MPRFRRRRGPRRIARVRRTSTVNGRGRRRMVANVSRREGMLSTNMHRYVRWEESDTTLVLPSASPGTAYGAKGFTLASLANATEFTALYDQYAITHVKAYVMWSPKSSGGTFTPTTNTFYASGVGDPIFYWKPDFDDVVVPSSLDTFKQSNKTKMTVLKPGKILKINLKPAVLTMIYESVGTTAYGPKWGQRIDCGDSSVPHYGLKYACDYLDLTDLGAITIRFKYWVKFWNVR